MFSEFHQITGDLSKNSFSILSLNTTLFAFRSQKEN